MLVIFLTFERKNFCNNKFTQKSWSPICTDETMKSLSKNKIKISYDKRDLTNVQLVILKMHMRGQISLARYHGWMEGYSSHHRMMEGEHEGLCAMTCWLSLERISPPAVLEPKSPWSKVGSTNCLPTWLLQPRYQSPSEASSGSLYCQQWRLWWDWKMGWLAWAFIICTLFTCLWNKWVYSKLNCHRKYVCLFVLRLNVPVNNFSVMSGRTIGNSPNCSWYRNRIGYRKNVHKMPQSEFKIWTQ